MEYSINFKPSKASFLQKKILFSFPLKINRQLVKMFPASWMSYRLNEGGSVHPSESVSIRLNRR